MDETFKTTVGGLRVYYPDVEHRRACTGFCHLHHASAAWWDGELEKQRIVFEKWAWREVRLGGQLFLLMDERSVLGVFEASS